MDVGKAKGGKDLDTLGEKTVRKNETHRKGKKKKSVCVGGGGGAK